MSTHCIIGHWPWKVPGTPRKSRPEVGRLVHYDGYPRYMVLALLQTYRDLGTVAAVRKYAIRPEERGIWSSYVPPGYKLQLDAVPPLVPCGPEQCDQTGIRFLDAMGGEFTCNYCSGKKDPATGLHMRRNPEKTRTWEPDATNGELYGLDSGLGAYAYSLDGNGIRVYSDDEHVSESFTPWSITPVTWMGATTQGGTA